MQTGKLRIYFGYAAGVGKTYAMLNEAQKAKKAGVDVVAGYIEPHNRPETTALLAGLEHLSPKTIKYKGITLKEFDIDAALKRQPHIILVDELAHTNSFGSRNKKRYQDIRELLCAGINVYTTVNVQHIESLNDVIETITGIQVNERIPDAIFNQADQIELVDIEPLDLLERLDKGKIYAKPQANLAKNHFFTEEKLIALREIALRKAADQINQSAIRAEKVKASLVTKEHVLVCVSPSPYASHVIRAASRLASAFNADFTALYIGSLDRESTNQKADNKLRQHLELAEQLGAKVSIVDADNVSKQIVDYAKVSHVSKLVVGKSSDKTIWPKENIVEVLSQSVPDLDIFVIPNARGKKAPYHDKFSFVSWIPKWQFSFSDLLKTLVMLLLVTLTGLLFRYWNFSVDNIITIYILGVQLNAVWTKGKLSSVISSILSVLCFNYFFTVPYYTFVAFSPNYPITFIIMLIAGLITSSLIKRIQEQARLSTEKSYRTELLLQTNKGLSQADTIPDILEELAVQVKKLLDRDVVIYPVTAGTLEEPKYFPTSQSLQTLADYDQLNERGVVEWVLHNNKRAGATTNTLSAAKFLYLSVRGKDHVFAIIGILMEDKAAVDLFEKSVILAVLGEAALALEKEGLREEQQKIELKMQKEQLRANLLRAISHDLRTPLTSISGQARLMMETGETLEKQQLTELATYIYDDSMWLINLVENLLSITKLDNDMTLSLSTNILDEVVEEALKHVDRHLKYHNFVLALSDDLLMAKMDGPLIVQVLINIINNAVKYTPEGSQITLTSKQKDQNLVVEVSDDGPGISDQAKEKVFDLFYTAENAAADGKRGLGIGLSLCKSIITAHGGTIYVRDNSPKGVTIGFTLPLVEVPVLHEK
ncbi:Sensor protein KdpD [Streptococcus canis]|uniref:histidine kinase n=1 Tax=Streptococcus canis TaxID=1329 RepID=A0A3P5XSZ8_STRCB|nr:sensor histidine kinase KdpD [Streptococcus canis]MDV5973504.1 sensor histidine kinase KdpD [Streptococcus canis]QKG76862.1 sensor histidine kinase KdpD [Streptococcus canis]VDC43655.1 Sensor protein KdpD [Streptococcus canis]